MTGIPDIVIISRLPNNFGKHALVFAPLKVRAGINFPRRNQLGVLVNRFNSPSFFYRRPLEVANYWYFYYWHRQRSATPASSGQSTNPNLLYYSVPAARIVPGSGQSTNPNLLYF